jgi:hypothetical protein
MQQNEFSVSTVNRKGLCFGKNSGLITVILYAGLDITDKHRMFFYAI